MLSFFITVQYYWALPAIVALMPLAYKIINNTVKFIGVGEAVDDLQVFNKLEFVDSFFE